MVTILTPTYNRAHTLPRLYESLKDQKEKKFEWIIVDDGSVDNTQSLVTSWILENEIKISYYKQENGGKHRAINNGVSHSHYDYIYIIDSDDYMTKDAIEKINGWISESCENPNLAGVSGLRGRVTKRGYEIIGQYPSQKRFIDATNLERIKFKLLGDKAEVYRRDILIKYPFPEFNGENFLSEEAVWNKVAVDGYKIRWYGEIICICEYLEDGLTKNSSDEMRLRNFNGYTYTQKLNAKWKTFPYNSFSIGEYIRIGRIKGLTDRDITKKIEVSVPKFYVSILLNGIRRLVNIIRK